VRTWIHSIKAHCTRYSEKETLKLEGSLIPNNSTSYIIEHLTGVMNLIWPRVPSINHYRFLATWKLTAPFCILQGHNVVFLILNLVILW